MTISTVNRSINVGVVDSWMVNHSNGYYFNAYPCWHDDWLRFINDKLTVKLVNDYINIPMYQAIYPYINVSIAMAKLSEAI